MYRTCKQSNVGKEDMLYIIKQNHRLTYLMASHMSKPIFTQFLA